MKTQKKRRIIQKAILIVIVTVLVNLTFKALMDNVGFFNDFWWGWVGGCLAMAIITTITE